MFSAVEFVEKLLFNEADKKVSITRSHFSAHSDSVNLLVIVIRERKATKSPDLSELLPSLIISRAFPSISSIVLPVPYAKKYTSAKRAADWVIVSANTLGMLRLTIKTLLNQSRDISTSRTILKNIWRFVAFPSILVILKAAKT